MVVSQTSRQWLAATLAAVVCGLGAQEVPKRDAQGYLHATDGHALYVYDADTVAGRSACTGPCAVVWPPYPVPAGAQAAAGFGVIVRTDGTQQWTYQARPLYRFRGDEHPGDTHGDGLNGSWHLAH